MLVVDILRGKGSGVVTVAPQDTVAELVATLAEQRIGAAVVSSDGRHVSGIVSERDVVRALASHGESAFGLSVEQIATREVAVAAPGDRLEHLAEVMTERRFRHLPIVVDGELQGIVSIGDVVKGRLAELEHEREALTDYITGQ